MKSLVVVSVFCFVALFHTNSYVSTSLGECDTSTNNRPQMVKLPSYKNSWQIQSDCSFPSRHNVAYVIKLFYKEWKLRFGDDDRSVIKNLNKLVITWEDKEKKISGIGFNVDGEPFSGRARGLTLMPGYIWVWTNPKYKRIAATALVHELVHAALWSKNKFHGDPDHEGDEFKGWTKEHTRFVKELNSILAHKDI